MSACLCRVGTGVLRCLFGFTLFQVNKILCLVCVCRAYAWLVTCPQVLTDGLCFVRELLKCNFSYISSATVGFIHMQTEGILPAAQWMARLGLLREPLTEIALHVAFYIKKKKKCSKASHHLPAVVQDHPYGPSGRSQRLAEPARPRVQ